MGRDPTAHCEIDCVLDCTLNWTISCPRVYENVRAVGKGRRRAPTIERSGSGKTEAKIGHALGERAPSH